MPAEIHTEFYDHEINSLKGLPILDAAFHLWVRRHYLTGMETNHTSLEEKNNKSAYYQSPDGVTKDRLKSLYPKASEKALCNAIMCAQQLEQSGNRHFSYSQNGGAEYWKDVTKAVATTKKQNPGFKEVSYSLLSKQLLRDNR